MYVPRFQATPLSHKTSHIISNSQFILVNKNSCPGDKSALRPGGLRVGTPALTSRNFKVKEFEKVAEYLHQGVQLGLEIIKTTGTSLKDFTAALEKEEFASKIKALREEIEEYSAKFPMPGHELI